MAEPDPQISGADWATVGEAITNGVVKLISGKGVQKVAVSSIGEGVLTAFHTLCKLLGEIGVMLAKTLMAAEPIVIPAFAGFAGEIIANMFGAEVSPSAFADRANKPGRLAAADAIVDVVWKNITAGTPNPLTASDEPAKRFAAVSVNAAIEGWFQSHVITLLESIVPSDVLHMNDWHKLASSVERTLPLGRLTRKALGPLASVMVATPLQWKLNDTYRPTGIPTSDAVRQYMRGHITLERLRERLAREGYTEDRIDELINGQRKFFSASDVRTFLYSQHWDNPTAMKHLRDQGYDEQTASDALHLEGLKRIMQNDNAISDAGVTAYANRAIERDYLIGLLSAYIENAAERALVLEIADVRRALAVKHLSPTQAAACVRTGILGFADYRTACERDGYDDEAIDALDLLLRHDVDEAQDIAAARAAQAAERAAAQLAKQQLAARRLADIEAERALQRRGSISDLRAAAVRGLIAIPRLEEVLAAEYDADTVQIIVDLVNDDRQRYLAQQQAAEDARKRAAARSIDVGTLEQAVLDGVLTMSEFARRLTDLQFTPADATLLTQVLQARKDALDAAAAKRAAAEQQAAIKHIDLTRFESLVRRGHRTLEDYDALLSSLGYDDASRAAMQELLQLKVNDDRAAEQLRAAAAAQSTATGPTLEQMRRAVILGVRTQDQFDTYLTANGYTADAHAILVAELQSDVAEADAARQRREAADQARREPVLPLATVERAARLGLVTPDVYLERLRADGYDEDDVAIASDLLLTEIADVQDKRQQRDQAAPAAKDGGLTLAQVEADVMAGTASIEDYRARAIALGLVADDAAALTDLLAAEVSAYGDAELLRADADTDSAGKGLSLAQLEGAVRAGVKTLDEYRSDVMDLGYAPDAAALLAAVLAHQLLTAATPATAQ
jgi:hypothetical protein